VLLARRYALASLSSLYLICGGFLRSRNRPLLFMLVNHFEFESKSAEPEVPPVAQIPRVGLEELLGQNVDITLSELSNTDGNISFLELIVITSLIRQYDPDLTIEIGTFDGRTTLNMALNQHEGSRMVTLNLPPSEIDAVDQPIEATEAKYILNPISGARFDGRMTPGKISQVFGDSATYDFDEYAGKVDVLFVDGSHSYEYALKDSRTARSLVRPGGVIIWHDYDTPHWFGVTRALNELCEQDPEFFGLKHVVDTSLCVLQT
jgi:predicted O-methyltransferase YrrM